MSKFTPLQIKTLETISGSNREGMCALEFHRGCIELGLMEEQPKPKYMDVMDEFFKHIRGENKNER